MAPVDLDSFEVLSFDCYGTLIDWEGGMLAAMRPVLEAHGVAADDEELLERYGAHEAALEAGPYQPYAEIVASALRGIGVDLGFEATDAEASAFAASVAEWPPFPDSPAALERLAERFRLAVITNCDDELFAGSQRLLGRDFDWVITAEQVRAYKPDRRVFELAFGRIGVGRDRILHVAQSLFHDHVPAREFGLSSVWVDRRKGRSGGGATPAADAEPDLTVASMGELAELAG